MGKFSWFLIGGVLGAGAALAFTPNTGEQTRALVAEKTNALIGEAKDFGAGLPDSATDAFNSARDQGASLLKDAQGKTTGLVGDASNAVKGATSKADQAEADELRAKIEAARQRIAAQVMENAEQTKETASSISETAAENVETIAASVEKADEAKHAAK